MADTAIKDGIGATPAQGSDKFPISRSGDKNILDVNDVKNYTLSAALKLTEVTTLTFTVTDEVFIIVDADTAGGNVVVTLPTAESRLAADGTTIQVKIKNKSTSKIVRILTPDAAEIEDNASAILAEKNSFTLTSDGTDWQIT